VLRVARFVLRVAGYGPLGENPDNPQAQIEDLCHLFSVICNLSSVLCDLSSVLYHLEKRYRLAGVKGQRLAQGNQVSIFIGDLDVIAGCFFGLAHPACFCP